MSSPVQDAAVELPSDETDRALTGIVATNVFAIVAVLVTGGGLLTLMWPYWVQSVVIGYYAWRRIRARDKAGSRALANFFAVHYGGFHLGYFAFLFLFTRDAAGTGVVPVNVNGVMRDFVVGTIGPLDVVSIVAIGIGFVLSHRASHREHLAADIQNDPPPKRLMGMPYARILPMHMTLIFGAMIGSGPGLALFGALKTVADVKMHKIEHRMLRQSH